jgi:hypothetical protein
MGVWDGLTRDHRRRVAAAAVWMDGYLGGYGCRFKAAGSPLADTLIDYAGKGTACGLAVPHSTEHRRRTCLAAGPDAAGSVEVMMGASIWLRNVERSIALPQIPR